MKTKFAITLATLLACSGQLFAQTVDIKDAWVRTSVQGQTATGAFMKLKADQAMKLVSIQSPVAGLTEVHEMKMDGDVMKMRAVQGGLDLPAGKVVELKPGGYHVMLMNLKAALPKDTTIPMTLVFKTAAGASVSLDIKLPVAVTAPDGKDMGGHQH